MPHNAPRIICYDIESSHNLAAVFALKQQDAYISSDNIVQERFVISVAWKELEAKTVQSVSLLSDPKRFKRDHTDDRHVLEVFHEVLMGADVLIAHNGDQFDAKMLKGRMLVHGLPPLPPILSIDTLKTARSQFLLNANNLDYLGHLLGVGHKKPTKQGLWLKVLKGDAAAIKEMVAYNKQDVLLLERVFLKLQPFIPDHVSRQLFTGGTACPRCGSSKVQSRGVHRALTHQYRRLQCATCGGWFRDRIATKGTASASRVL